VVSYPPKYEPADDQLVEAIKNRLERTDLYVESVDEWSRPIEMTTSEVGRLLARLKKVEADLATARAQWAFHDAEARSYLQALTAAQAKLIEHLDTTAGGRRRC